MNISFEFINTFIYRNPADSYLLEIPKGVSSKASLFAAFESAGQFPEYFGSNWDAFSDCLRDFGWVQEKQIVILHRDLPLAENAADCRIYLETLQAAIEDWTASPARLDIGDASTDSITQELAVVFPANLRQDITTMLFGHRAN
ncbi:MULTISPECIES: barstar family protein [unclassified Polaromonas]|uniref:barstar family protein n=1 Tax=unclassified Polaromonas TaxID=2638319 RepID=UPI000F07F125|nr:MULTISPECIES: barstar family protein [unclassified Polaromonas]AYQ27476.1 hypothetical protein DT070_05180 [Polaromonas sp. SP1]QGJ17684.1 hypothetical protein F7R28_04270 [Polaromonas sp. Pch-P]